jgi:UDP-N-acetyl-D-glucosamine dehydrogenase
MELMLQRGAKNVTYNDPYVPKIKVADVEFSSLDLSKEVIENADVILITAAHSDYDCDFIVSHANAIVDTRNATKNVKDPDGKVLRLGGGQRI